MITGFNTDVEHDGRMFHVQTEDKGASNPVVESLIYCGGEIIDSRRHAYADLAVEGGFREEQILARMESQHQTMIREIRNGKFDLGGPKPFGHNIITNRSLDEVVRAFLDAEDRLAAIELLHTDGVVLLQGSSPALRLHVVERGSERPVAAARVRVRLVSTEDAPRELFRGDTGSDGAVEARLEIPDAPSADLAIVCQAEAAGHRAELRQLVHRARPARPPREGS